MARDQVTALKRSRIRRKTHRLIASKYPTVGVFDDLTSDPTDVRAAFILEALTNDRLAAQRINLLPDEEMIAGASSPRYEQWRVARDPRIWLDVASRRNPSRHLCRRFRLSGGRTYLSAVRRRARVQCEWCSPPHRPFSAATLCQKGRRHSRRHSSHTMRDPSAPRSDWRHFNQRRAANR